MVNYSKIPVKLLLCLWLLVSCVASSIPSAPDESPQVRNPTRRVTFFVADHGWHTGLILPREEITALLPDLAGDFPPGGRYLDFGWGDEVIYQARGISSPAVCGAVLWPTRAVMNVMPVSAHPAEFYIESEIVTVTVFRRDLARMADFIRQSFALDVNGRPKRLSVGDYGDLFYRANGAYHAFNTCNTWTARALSAAGLPVSASGTLTAGSVMRQLRNHLDGKE